MSEAPDSFRPTNLTIFIGLMSDKQAHEEIHKYCKERWKPYPAGGDTLFVWKTFLLAGIEISYFDRVDSMRYWATRSGWTEISSEDKPKVGDIVVYRRGKFDVCLEFVAKTVMNSDDYIGLGPEGYGRRTRKRFEDLSFPEDRNVLGFLRYNCKECALKKKLREKNA